MTPYRGKHRRTTADEEPRPSEAAEPAASTSPEDDAADQATRRATPLSGPGAR
jgi:hypothetical protein